MRIFPTKFAGQIYLCLFISSLFSCSKDSDLIAGYVSPGDSNGTLLRYVVDDSFIVPANASIRLNVLENDILTNGENVTISRTSSPTNGSVSINEDNSLTYISNGPASSSDSFTYTAQVQDENEALVEETGSVTIIVSDSKPIDMGPLKAFPGAEGFGKYSAGGRGGKVILVTNLNDSGPGSLRSAINSDGPRIVVFKVSGYITLNSPLLINNDRITIAGQTSPGDGITLRINPTKDISTLQVSASDVIIRGIRIRPGKTSTDSVNGDAVTLTSGNRIIFDHCSFSWSTDEIINPYGSSQVTFQNCIFSEALMFASHAYSTDPNNSQYPNPHSMGMLLGNQSSEISIYNSIFAHNNQRNPLIGGDNDPGDKFELVNNIYYNWGEFGTVLNSSLPMEVNMINNIYISGPDTDKNRYPVLVNDKVRLYAKGNINDFRINNTISDALAIGRLNAPFNLPATSINFVNEPFDYPLSNQGLLDANELLNLITTGAGAFKRDNVDERIINDILSNSGRLINLPSDVGGYPELTPGESYIDSDSDGMSDEWEISHSLNPTNTSDRTLDPDGDGYTNLDTFLHVLTQD